MNESGAQFWDAWWEKKFSLFTPHGAFMSLHDSSVLSVALRLDGSRQCHVLLPGNGWSLVPYALAACGFEVVVIDISKLVLERLATKASEGEILRYLTVPARSLTKSHSHSGGSVTLVHGDVFSYQFDRQFDLIYEDRLAMLLNERGQAKLAEQYHSWLQPGGLCAIRTINYGLRRTDEGVDGSAVEPLRAQLEAAFSAVGFRETKLKQEDKQVEYRHGLG
nr:methyltransferase domain-containing protein [Armatimonas sp.]